MNEFERIERLPNYIFAVVNDQIGRASCRERV